MSKEEFEKYIESIGFEYIEKPYTVGLYCHKEYRISLFDNFYKIVNINNNEWSGWYNFDHLKPLRKFDRSYKLKKILG